MRKRQSKPYKRRMSPSLKQAIIRASTREQQHHLFVETDRCSLFCGDAISAGTTYDPHTHHWLTWLSTNGWDLTILCSHDDQAKANAVVQAITSAVRADDFADEGKLPMLLRQWRANGSLMPYASEETLATIGHAILQHVIPLQTPSYRHPLFPKGKERMHFAYSARFSLCYNEEDSEKER